MKHILIFFLLFIILYPCCNATVWHVGPSKTYKKPSQIKDLVQDGDFIYIEAGVYINVTGCWMHHPRGQANALKTRAQRSYILYNLIDEEADGYGSWEVNIAQGGLNIILGNVIIQSATGANHGIIGYDAATNDLEDFYFVNNTVINKYPGNIKYFNISPSSGINTFFIYNNIFASVPGANNTFLTGNTPAVLDSSHNLFALDYLTLGFTDPSEDDFSLTSASASAINRGIYAGSATTGFNLYPVAMPRTRNNADGTQRLNLDGVIDIGANEYYPSAGVENKPLMQEVSVYPNPSEGKFNFVIRNCPVAEKFTLSVCDIRGKDVHAFVSLTPDTNQKIDLTGLPRGIYFAKISNRHSSIVVKLSVL